MKYIHTYIHTHTNILCVNLNKNKIRTKSVNTQKAPKKIEKTPLKCNDRACSFISQKKKKTLERNILDNNSTVDHSYTSFFLANDESGAN